MVENLPDEAPVPTQKRRVRGNGLTVDFVVRVIVMPGYHLLPTENCQLNCCFLKISLFRTFNLLINHLFSLMSLVMCLSVD